MERQSDNIDKSEKLLALEEELSRHISDLTAANKRLKRKIFDLYTIFEISRHLNSVLDTRSLLDGIILTIIGQMGVSGCGILVADSAESGLELSESKGLSINPKFRYSISYSSALFRVIEEAPTASHHLSDLSARLPAQCPEVALLKSLDCELVIPMSLKNRICGLLIVTGKISRTPFYEDDKDFLAILANQLAVAVENARLFESEKQAYIQLSRTQRQLVESEKLAALGQLAARGAHEVNNPLGVIKNFLELLYQSSGGSEQMANYVNVLREEVNRIAKIVRQLFEFYHTHSIEKSAISVTQVLDEIIFFISTQLQANKIEINRNYPTRLPSIWASAEQLKQVFLNLIMNACDFMPDGGQIEIHGYAQDELVVLEFSDNGPGIAEEAFSKIFEPFYTTKKDGAGTGLGLSVCYGIIQNHGGTITAKNRPKGGAVFTIALPIFVEKNG